MRSRRLLHVPVIGQTTDFECGNTCLASVVQYHGKHYSTAQLLELAGTKQEGTDHRGLVDAAVATGATVIARDGGSYAELADFVGRGLPVIVGWWSMGAGDTHFDRSWSVAERRERDCGHYSVVCGVTPDGFVFMDPDVDDDGRTIGLCEKTDEEFAPIWYDTDTDAYEHVMRWYMVVSYEYGQQVPVADRPR